MLLFVLFSLVCVCSSGRLQNLDVCHCAKTDGVYICSLEMGTSLKASTCKGASLRTTGRGFVTYVEPGTFDGFFSVTLERTTLTCDAVQGQAVKTLIIDNVVCPEPESTTSTTTKAPVPTKEPRARPPAFPVEDGGDDDDHNDDDDDDDDNDPLSPMTTSTDTLSSSPISLTTQRSTTARIITITAVAEFRGWLVAFGVGVLIVGGGIVIVIIRIRLLRRRRNERPVQVEEVSSTSSEPQRTYVLRQMPRSPRSRRSASSMESVTLFAVDDNEL